LEVTILILKITGEYVHSITVFEHVGNILCDSSGILCVLLSSYLYTAGVDKHLPGWWMGMEDLQWPPCDLVFLGMGHRRRMGFKMVQEF
jgi:hypothetical protein